MTIQLEIIILILGTHFLADFILQSDWMAKNKSKSNRALLVHVGIYTTTFLIIFSSAGLNGLYFALINGAAHFIVDYVTSRINSYLWAKGQIHNFFSGIGADQLIHYITLFVTYTLIFN